MVRRACESLVAILLSLTLGTGCKPPKARGSVQLEPLVASSWLVDLDVPGFGAAKVAVPLGAVNPRPLVIALHGSADRPEWTCSAVRGLAGPTPFVLCPRGVARTESNERFTFESSEQTSKELRAGLTALKQRYGAYLASGPVQFVGLQIGADHAAAIARQEPTFFSRLLLIEPSPEGWPASQAATFGRTGGQRVLFAFGPEHRDELLYKVVLTQRGGAEAKGVFLGDRPPALDPVAVDSLKKDWGWLSGKASKAASPENLAGNALPANGPTVGRPAP